MFTRRQFIKGLAATAGVASVPSFLLGSSIVKAQESTTMPDAELGRWRFSGAHWGAFRARVVADRVVEIKPFEFDKHPTPILDGTMDVIYSACLLYTSDAADE